MSNFLINKMNRFTIQTKFLLAKIFSTMQTASTPPSPHHNFDTAAHALCNKHVTYDIGVFQKK
jgi:hypothetical protein